MLPWYSPHSGSNLRELVSSLHKYARPAVSLNCAGAPAGGGGGVPGPLPTRSLTGFGAGPPRTAVVMALRTCPAWSQRMLGEAARNAMKLPSSGMETYENRPGLASAVWTIFNTFTYTHALTPSRPLILIPPATL